MERCCYIIWKTARKMRRASGTGRRMENESRTVLLSLLKLRQMHPNESYGEGLRQLPAESCHPAATAGAEDVPPGHYFPIQRTSVTSTTAVGGFGLRFLVMQRAAEMWGQRLPPPRGSSGKFTVVTLLFAPHCEQTGPLASLRDDIHPHVLLSFCRGCRSPVVPYLWLEWSKS